jgi:hypothetical protein
LGGFDVAAALAASDGVPMSAPPATELPLPEGSTGASSAFPGAGMPLSFLESAAPVMA